MIAPRAGSEPDAIRSAARRVPSVRTRLRLLRWHDDDRAGVLSPRTPIVVRCATCLARFGEVLGKPARRCPFCTSLARV